MVPGISSICCEKTLPTARYANIINEVIETNAILLSINFILICNNQDK